MKCKVKEHIDGDSLYTAAIMRMDGEEMQIIETALKDMASRTVLGFNIRAKVVDMVRAIQDPEVVE